MKFRFFSLLIAIASIVSFVSCNSDNKKNQGPKPTKFEQDLVSEDSMQVKALISQYFDYVLNKNYTEAVAMLYKVNDDGMPEVLDNDDMAQVRNMLEVVPVVDYRVEYIKFNERTSNEVLCYIIMNKPEEGMPEMTTKMFFKPVLNAGTWYLCLTNTGYGDNGVVDPLKRDSVKFDYHDKYGE